MQPEDKDHADEHPDVEVADVAHLRHVLPANINYQLHCLENRCTQ